MKCAVYRYWSLERTLWLWPTPSRRAQVRERRDERERKQRVRAVVRRVRRVMHAVWFIRVLVEVRLKDVMVEGGDEEGKSGESAQARTAVSRDECVAGVDHGDCVEMVPLEWDEKSSLV